MKTLIIAEAGVNHNGDFELAKKLVDKAYEAGADIVKFQTCKAENVISRYADKAEYQKKTTGEADSQLEMVRKLMLTYEQYGQLKEYCDEKGIEFLSTAFDLPSVDYLHSIGMRRWKIPSGEITNLPLLLKIANLHEPIIMSTGMSDLSDVEEAVEVLKDPCIHLSADETEMLHKYVNLALDITKANPQFVKESIGGLVSSVFYQFAGFLADSKRRQDMETPVRTTRQRQMFEQFMKLAVNDHAKEHLVGYYADKMCVTPKYLSKIVKEASGRSVPEWLSELLILDAKNMLRHTDMTIKEISARLNFPSQSFFFRFFKNHTGQTPTQYREE